MAFECSTCHVVPPDDDVEHTLSYQPSDDLSTPGHHGDVLFASSVSGMSFAVDATSGTPQTARGTCLGACHSDGRGGDPVQTPYWAGGAWTSGCGSCHAAEPRSGTHRHAMDEGGTCANCHAGSTTNAYSATTHFNGAADFLGTVQGQGMTLKADSRCASGVSCNGSCHGEDEEHDNACW
jgi:predicted CxxxxCH...CXXCH cytochrome family protein